jgi:hypothetical protein
MLWALRDSAEILTLNEIRTDAEAVSSSELT